MPRADVAIGALVGMIGGSIGHHSMEGLVSAPLWVMIATGIVFGVALLAAKGEMKQRTFRPVYMKQRTFRSVYVGLAAGFLAGWTLPATLPPPRSSIITHAAVHTAHADLFEALDLLDERPHMLLGKRIAVSGLWHPRYDNVLATVSRRVMACCAADAVDVGFDVRPARAVAAPFGASVRVTGVVQASLRDGEVRYVLSDADVEVVSEGSTAAK